MTQRHSMIFKMSFKEQTTGNTSKKLLTQSTLRMFQRLIRSSPLMTAKSVTSQEGTQWLSSVSSTLVLFTPISSLRSSRSWTSSNLLRSSQSMHSQRTTQHGKSPFLHSNTLSITRTRTNEIDKIKINTGNQIFKLKFNHFFFFLPFAFFFGLFSFILALKSSRVFDEILSGISTSYTCLASSRYSIIHYTPIHLNLNQHSLTIITNEIIPKVISPKFLIFIEALLDSS